MAKRYTSQRLKNVKTRPWSLRRLVKQGHNPTAFVLWVALQDIAREEGRRVINPTHALLKYLTGIDRSQSISRALTTLHNAGWIRCELTRKGVNGGYIQLLTVTLRRKSRKITKVISEEVKMERAAAIAVKVEEMDLPWPTGPHDSFTKAIAGIRKTYGNNPGLQLLDTCRHEYIPGNRLTVFFNHETDLKAALDFQADLRLKKRFQEFGDFVDVEFCLTKPAAALAVTTVP